MLKSIYFQQYERNKLKIFLALHDVIQVQKGRFYLFFDNALYKIFLQLLACKM